MISSLSPKTGLAAIILLACTTTIKAHSWVQMLRLIDASGTFVGAPGYPRGFVDRNLPSGAGNPAWSDFAAENKVPPDGRPSGSQILKTDLMCASYQQIGNQTSGFPTLTAAPQDFVSLLYAENGHVTKDTSTPPNTRPAGNGTVFIYGTSKPSNDDTYLGIHRVWNAQGTGGDSRGKLLATRYFDDGQCYQISTNPLSVARQAEFKNQTEQLCQNDVQLPVDAGTSGKYTLYWVWEYPTMSITTGGLVTNESYTTCMDITMGSSPVSNKVNLKEGQPVGSAAVKPQLAQAIIVNPTAPLVIKGAPPAPLTGGSASPPASGNASSAAPPPAPAASSAPPAASPAASPAAPPKASAPAAPAPSSPQAPSIATVTVTVTQTINNGAAPTSAVQSSPPNASSNPPVLPPKPSSAPAPASPSPASASKPAISIAPSTLSAAPFQARSDSSSATVSSPTATVSAASPSGDVCTNKTQKLTGRHPHRRRSLNLA